MSLYDIMTVDELLNNLDFSFPGGQRVKEFLEEIPDLRHELENPDFDYSSCDGCDERDVETCALERKISAICDVMETGEKPYQKVKAIRKVLDDDE